MKTTFICILFLFVNIVSTYCQETNSYFKRTPSPSRNGQFFFYWGYNRANFAPSDIHFHGPNYDFTLYNVVAKDRPSPFGNVYYLPNKISIPQYNARLGYVVSNHWQFSVGIDHMKYVMERNQHVTISGIIDSLASPKYAGSYLNDSISITEDFVKFEHTDGLNCVNFDVEYCFLQYGLYKNTFRLRLFAGAGGILVIPRSDVRVFGHGLNNNFHLAGYSINAKGVARIEFLQHFFFDATWRSGLITLPDILIHNNEPLRANQNINFVEYYFTLGYYFKL